MEIGAADERTRPADDPRWPVRSLPVIVTLVLFLVAMLAASIAGPPLISLPDTGRPAPIVVPQEQVTPTASPPAQPEETGIFGMVMSIVLLLLVIAVVLAVAYVLVRALLRWAGSRAVRPPAQDPAPTDAEALGAESGAPAPDAAVIRRGLAAARADITTYAEPGDAIVAAWVGLEETAADSGTARGRSETPAEFTLRILLRRTGIDAPTRRLLRLYEGVRFAGRSASEQDRVAAREALIEIERGWR